PSGPITLIAITKLARKTDSNDPNSHLWCKLWRYEGAARWNKVCKKATAAAKSGVGRELLLEGMLESSRKAHRHNQVNTQKAAGRGSNAVPGIWRCVTFCVALRSRR